LVDKLFDFIHIGAHLHRRGSSRATLDRKWATTIPQRNFRIRAPITTTIGRGTRIKGTGMTELQNRLAAEREEIATRVANFKATQEKFEREREEYFVTTLENARHSSGRPPSWS